MAMTDDPAQQLHTALRATADQLNRVADTLRPDGSLGETAHQMMELAPLITSLGSALTELDRQYAAHHAVRSITQD